MSEKPKAENVSKAELTAIMEQMGNTMTESLQAAITQMEDVVSKKINANTLEISKTLSEHADAIVSIAKKLEGTPQATAGQGTVVDKAQGFLQLLDHPLIKQKLGLEPVPDANEGLAQLAVRGMQRELNKQLVGVIRKQFKRGNLLENEVAEYITDKSLIEHGI